jgi:hypothetical protein
LPILVLSSVVFDREDAQTGVLELGITQPEAKLESRRDLLRVKMAIVDEQSAN